MNNLLLFQELSKRRKEGFKKKQAKALHEKGLLIVHTGQGKGKSTAAWGMVLRCLGHNKRVGIVQFIKGAMPSAERDILTTFPLCDFFIAGQGYTWDTQNREADIADASQGWETALQMIKSKQYTMIVLDELNVVLKYNYLALDKVITELTQRPPNLHVVITGRHASPLLIEAADLVTEMKLIKHPYKNQGIKAQAGIEF